MYQSRPLCLHTMSVGMSQKVRKVACMKSGMILVLTKAFIVVYGLLVLEVSVLVSVAYMRLVTVISVKNLTTKWIGTSRPNKWKRRLVEHKKLKEQNPDSKEIFEGSLIDTYYPERPSELDSVCLYDVAQNYEKCGVNKDGVRKYRKLSKPCLITGCTILTRRMNEMIITIPSCCFLFLLEMKIH